MGPLKLCAKISPNPASIAHSVNIHRRRQPYFVPGHIGKRSGGTTQELLQELISKYDPEVGLKHIKSVVEISGLKFLIKAFKLLRDRERCFQII